MLAETQNGVYTHAVLYYLDAQEELAEIQLVPAELSIKAEFKTSVLYSKFKFAVNDGGYDFANLYYFDYDNSAFKRVETTYNAETGKYTVSAGDADKTLYTHGKAVGVWKYLLTDKDGMEMICTVNNIGSLVANVSYNVEPRETQRSERGRTHQRDFGKRRGHFQYAHSREYLAHG